MTIIVQGNTLINDRATVRDMKKLTDTAIPNNIALPYSNRGYTLLEPAEGSKPNADHVSYLSAEQVDGVWTRTWSSRDYTSEELLAQDAVATAELKLTGVAFTDATSANSGTIMCSATKEDMWGLTSVQMSIGMGNTENFKFDNGNVVVLTPSNAAAFIAVWAPFRSSFF